MARPEMTAHVHVTHLTGLLECDCCGTLCSFKRAWEEICESPLVEAPCPWCGGAARELVDTALLLAKVEVGGSGHDLIVGGLE